MIRVAYVLAVIIAPLSAEAQSFVSDSSFCGQDVNDIIDAGHAVMTATTLDAPEWFCEWNDPVSIMVGTDAYQTTIGYCSGSDQVWPSVMTFVTDDYEPDILRLYTSDGEGIPQIFSDCGGN